MHGRPTSPAEQFLHGSLLEFAFRNVLAQFADDVPQAVDLPLALQMGRRPAGILDIPQPAHYLESGSGPPAGQSCTAKDAPQLDNDIHRDIDFSTCGIERR